MKPSVRLQIKLTLIFGGISAAILAGIFFYLHTTLTQTTYARMEDALRKETLFARTFVEQNVLPVKSPQSFQQTAREISRSLNTRTTIIRMDGTVVADSGVTAGRLGDVDNHLYRPEVQTALKTGFGHSRRFSTTVKRDMLYAAAVFGPSEKAEGIIRLAIPLSEMEELSARLKRFLFVSLLCAFALAVLAGFLASWLIAKPLTEIARIAKKIAQGDFSEKIYIPRSDIFGELAGTFNEMSEQVQNRMDEVALEKSRLEAVLLSMFEGVLVVDKQERVLLMNQAFRKLINVADNPVGRKALEVIRNIQVQETIAEALRSQKAVESREISILLTEEKVLLVHAAPVVLNGGVEGVVLVFHDITELRRLERIRREFVANVSHELRTPASNIKGYTETLLEGALDDKDHAREFLNIIQDNSERLANLIEGLLDLSRIESGKVAMNLTPCALQPIVKKTLEILDSKIRKKDLHVENRVPEKIPQADADAAQIVQVLVNLVDNAIKYTASGGTIAICAKEAGRFVQMEVRDSGIGIPDADQPRVFERFYRVDKARSRELGGSGLGLSIVKHIVQAHGGEVSVESRLGEGSTFRFTLPMAGA